MKKKCMVLFLSLSMVLTLFVGGSDSKDSEKQLQKVTLNEVCLLYTSAPREFVWKNENGEIEKCSPSSSSSQ